MFDHLKLAARKIGLPLVFFIGTCTYVFKDNIRSIFIHYDSEKLVDKLNEFREKGGGDCIDGYCKENKNYVFHIGGREISVERWSKGGIRLSESFKKDNKTISIEYNLCGLSDFFDSCFCSDDLEIQVEDEEYLSYSENELLNKQRKEYSEHVRNIMAQMLPELEKRIRIAEKTIPIKRFNQEKRKNKALAMYVPKGFISAVQEEKKPFRRVNELYIMSRRKIRKELGGQALNNEVFSEIFKQKVRYDGGDQDNNYFVRFREVVDGKPHNIFCLSGLSPGIIERFDADGKKIEISYDTWSDGEAEADFSIRSRNGHLHEIDTRSLPDDFNKKMSYRFNRLGNECLGQLERKLQSTDREKVKSAVRQYERKSSRILGYVRHN